MKAISSLWRAGFLAALFGGFAAGAAFGASPSGVWRDLAEKPLLAARGGVSAQLARNGVVPSSYRTLHLDRDRLAAALGAAPAEGSLRTALAAGAPAEALPAPVVIELPIPRSTAFARFTVENSPIMEPALAAKYPAIQTYIAQGIDNPELTARLDVTPLGFHAQILSPAGQIIIDPYFLDGSDPSTAIVFYKRDYPRGAPEVCLVGGASMPTREMLAQISPGKPTGASLKLYRLAVATTGEYAVAAGGGDATMTLGAVVTSVNRVDLVYERELSIRMILIANEDKLIYTNASTDPYSNTSASTLLTQNQSTCDSVIGSANYDIGHVFSTGGGGLAGLGVVCRNGVKARGETGSSRPLGDPYDIDYVAHEMGHQFGGNHPFNATSGSCTAANRNASTAYEVGSGTTIMAYAGICIAQNLAPNSDDYFYGISYDEIDTYTSGAGLNTVVPPVATGNNPPVVTTAGGNFYTIPIGTPFRLTAAATDADGDRLTYCWEEFDKGAAQNPVATPRDNGASPIFRSYAPTVDPTRTFPALPYILNNANVPPATLPSGFISGEFLPSTSRTMVYRCTVRDNRAGGGGADYTTASVVSTTSAGPFAVTAPNTAASYAAGASVAVTWNAANTTAAPVSCANVKITLSTDGGLTFPYVLASSVPNSGSATVTLPAAASVATAQARLKVEAVGNIFFDISDADFTITAPSGALPPTFTASGGGITVVRGTPAAVTAAVGSATPGTSALANVAVSGVPDGATVTGAISGNGDVVLTARAECRLTTTLTTRNYPINITVTDAAGATGSGVVNLIIAPNASPSVGSYANVSVGQNGIFTVVPSAAPADANGNLLAAALSLSPTTPLPAGVTLALDQSTGAATFAASATAAKGATAVRLQVQDTCGATSVGVFTLTVTSPVTSAPVFINVAPPDAATVGAPYSYTFAANGSPAPTYSVTAGTLPPGLSLNATAGVLSGAPATAGVYGGIQVTASNGVAPSAVSQTFSIRVVNTVGITRLLMG